MQREKVLIKIHGYQACILLPLSLLSSLTCRLPGFVKRVPRAFSWVLMLYFLNDREMGEGRITILAVNGNFSKQPALTPGKNDLSKCPVFCLKQRGSRRMLVSISPIRLNVNFCMHNRRMERRKTWSEPICSWEELFHCIAAIVTVHLVFCLGLFFIYM